MTRRVWPISKGCSLLIGTWFYLYLFGSLCCSALNLCFVLWIFWDGLRFVIVIISYTFHIKQFCFLFWISRLIHYFIDFFFVHHSLYYAIINRKTTLFNISTKYLLITIPFWAVWCPKTRYLSTPKCSLLLRKWAIY